MSASDLAEYGEPVSATHAGVDVFKSKVYVFKSKPADAAATVDPSLKLDDSVSLDPSWFGGFRISDGCEEAYCDIQVYYKNKKWKAVLNGVTCEYRYNIQSRRRRYCF